jgi:hypothetical protein
MARSDVVLRAADHPQKFLARRRRGKLRTGAPALTFFTQMRLQLPRFVPLLRVVPKDERILV